MTRHDAIRPTVTALTNTGRRFFVVLLFLPIFASLSSAAEDHTAFFESRIRPLLIENCVQCHGADKQKGGLRLDSREGWQRGGDSGQPVTPGKPDESLLSKAVSYTHRDLKMPPKKKLSDAQIADLNRWIEMGAPDPRNAPAVSSSKHKTLTIAEGRNFWSYQLPKDHAPPKVINTAWPLNEIDHFILAKLEEKNLSPSPDADPLTLRRRLSFDLTGLPPEEMTPGPTDIDSLLASPHFAERMASHWMDIVRFAESSGGGRTLPFKDAWRYRDYVIESFHQDMPLTQFLTEQIAGDLLPHDTAAERRRHLTATGFLALGPTNYEEQDKQMLRMDIVDEQLDTIGRSFLGQTIGCARCHDHKFDPIPTRDYYALAGIFRSTRTLENYTDNVAHWIEKPLPLDGAQEIAMQAHEKKLGELKTEIARARDLLRAKAGTITTAKKAVPVDSLPGIVVDDADAMKVGGWAVSSRFKPYVGTGYSHDDNNDKGGKTITFTPKIPKTGRYEVRVAFNAGPTRAETVIVTIFHADGEALKTIKQHTDSVEGIEFASVGTYRFEDSGQGYVIISNGGSQGYVTVDAVQFLPESGDATETTAETSRNPETSAMKKKLSEMEKAMKSLEKEMPPRPEVMAVHDDETIEDSPVHIRGSIRNLGAPVPRGFLEVAMHGTAPVIPADQSGRLQFAQWMCSERNPLTARVYVNRVWHWLIGAGLVRSTENFGTTGELPSHPELLDYLALRFMREGWSTKKLVKFIITSRTYRQSSAQAGPAHSIDPDNRLLSRMNRKRLDAESMRDAILLGAGTLDRAWLGSNLNAGRADSNSTASQNLEYNFEFTDTRRSVYTPAFRNVRHPLFEVFDFADVNQPIAQRTTSTVATQALFMTNHPLVMAQARAAASRLLSLAKEDTQRIHTAYHLTLSRPPTTPESAIARDFIEASTSGNSDDQEIRDIWARFIQSLWSTPEFRYLK